MSRVTIEAIGPDCALLRSALYCASRDEGGDYAFGDTEAAALAKLVSRETAQLAAWSSSLAEEVAFLALGAAEAIRSNRGVDLRAYDGYMGLVSETIAHAPLLAERWRQIEASGFDGVWLYDVSERFGREWVQRRFDGESLQPEPLLDYIIADEQQKWATEP